MSAPTRRTADVAGWTVTVITKQGEAGPIETVRGGPRCLNCGSKLRPRYQMTYRWQDTEHLFTEEPEGQYCTWDTARQKWVITTSHRVITGRKWCGNFGGNADNKFCGTTCGWRWAARHAKHPPQPK
jgi:hypothetical protein